MENQKCERNGYPNQIDIHIYTGTPVANGYTAIAKKMKNKNKKNTQTIKSRSTAFIFRQFKNFHDCIFIAC